MAVDWGLVGVVVAIVVPAVGGMSGLVAWIFRSQLEGMKTAFKLMLAESNADMLRLINGTYVRKESLDDKLKVAAAAAHEDVESKLTRRMEKVETDIRNVGGSIARFYRQPEQG